MTVTHRPPWLSVAVSLFAAVVACASVALSRPVGLAPAALGVLALAAGLSLGARRGVTLGAVGLFGGVLLAGAQGGGPEALVLGLLGTVVAWDVGEHAVGLGEQLGREATTTRSELVHAAASLAVGAAGATLGYGVFLVAAGGQPTTALVFLLIGVVALAAAVRS